MNRWLKSPLSGGTGACLPVGRALPARSVARGFTLAELLIAIAILGVGLSMTAALFPAAMHESQRTTDDVDGTLACHNVLAISLARFTNGTNPFTAATTLTVCPAATLGNDTRYPLGATDDHAGVLLFGRRMTAGVNDYQLIMVGYRNTGTSTARPTVTALAGCAFAYYSNDSSLAESDRRGQITFATLPATVKVGSPVLVRADGSWARIVLIDGTKAVLDHNPLPSPGTGSRDVYVISEAGMPLSPATTVLVTRTALRE